MQIALKHCKTSAIIGIYPHERSTPQTILFEAVLEYEFNGQSYIDYSEIVKIINTTLQNGEFLLLEDAIENIENILFSTFSALQTITISLCKPAVLEIGEIWVSHTKTA